MSLGRSIYAVWEAKKLSELSPKVGRETIMLVCDRSSIRNKNPKFLSARGDEFLDAQYETYGPRDVPKDFTLPEGFYMKD